MAKYTKEQVKVHKRFLTIADMKAIAEGNPHTWETLRNALYGQTHFDKGSSDKKKMIKQARQLIHKRATEAIDVVNPKTVK